MTENEKLIYNWWMSRIIGTVVGFSAGAFFGILASLGCAAIGYVVGDLSYIYITMSSEERKKWFP